MAGEVYVQNGNTAEAARYFEKAAALDPKDPRKRTAMALSHLQKGEQRGLARAGGGGGRRHRNPGGPGASLPMNVRQNKFDAALNAVASIEKKQPDKPLAHDLRGSVLPPNETSPARGGASSAHSHSIRPTTRRPRTWRELDLLEKKPDDATKRFEAILAKDPKNVQALLAIAELARSGAADRRTKSLR